MGAVGLSLSKHVQERIHLRLVIGRNTPDLRVDVRVTLGHHFSSRITHMDPTPVSLISVLHITPCLRSQIHRPDNP